MNATSSRRRLAGIDLATRAKVLASFALFFQLANIAEQHHRVRRRRDYEREGRIAPETIEDAIAQLGRAGVAGEELGRVALDVRVEPVLTAHPDRSDASHRSRRSPAHRQAAAHAGRPVADAVLGASVCVDGLSAEITALWQTDVVRSTRPRVVDEIRTGLWFFETSLWDAAPAVVRTLQGRIPGAPTVLRFGTWIGGDMDGNPAAGADTVREAVDRARALARDLYRGDIRELAQGWGMSTTVIGTVAGARGRGRRAVPGLPHARSGSDSARTGTATAPPSPEDLALLDRTLRAHHAGAIADGALADLRARVDVFGLGLASLDLRAHAREVRAGASRLAEALRETAQAAAALRARRSRAG